MQTERQSRTKTTAPVEPEKRYHDEHYVAELLGISVSTVRRWRLLGKGPAYRKFAGASVRYGDTDIQAFIANSPVGGQCEVA